MKVRNDRDAIAPMRGLLIGLPLGALTWAVLVEIVLWVAHRPDPVSWLAAYVVGPGGLLLALGAAFVVARGLVRDILASSLVDGAHPPEPIDRAGPALGRTGPARLSSNRLPVSWR